MSPLPPDQVCPLGALNGFCAVSRHASLADAAGAHAKRHFNAGEATAPLNAVWGCIVVSSYSECLAPWEGILTGLRLLIITVVAAMLPTFCLSKTINLYHKGGWQVFGGLATNNAPVCGMSTIDSSSSRMFFIKYFPKSSEPLDIQIFKQGWHIPPSVKAKISITIDRNAPWIAEATAINGTDLSGLETYINKEKVVDFLKEIKDGNMYIIHFFEGSEVDWYGSLNGSSAAMDKFFMCANYLDQKLGIGSGNSQPYSTQPYVNPNSGGRSTQPFSSNGNLGSKSY